MAIQESETDTEGLPTTGLSKRDIRTVLASVSAGISEMLQHEDNIGAQHTISCNGAHADLTIYSDRGGEMHRQEVGYGRRFRPPAEMTSHIDPDLRDEIEFPILPADIDKEWDAIDIDTDTQKHEALYALALERTRAGKEWITASEAQDAVDFDRGQRWVSRTLKRLSRAEETGPLVIRRRREESSTGAFEYMLLPPAFVRLNAAGKPTAAIPGEESEEAEELEVAEIEDFWTGVESSAAIEQIDGRLEFTGETTQKQAFGDFVDYLYTEDYITDDDLPITPEGGEVPFVASDPDAGEGSGMFVPVETDSGLFVETNMQGSQKLERMEELLRRFVNKD